MRRKSNIVQSELFRFHEFLKRLYWYRDVQRLVERHNSHQWTILRYRWGLLNIILKKPWFFKNLPIGECLDRFKFVSGFHALPLSSKDKTLDSCCHLVVPIRYMTFLISVADRPSISYGNGGYFSLNSLFFFSPSLFFLVLDGRNSTLVSIFWSLRPPLKD